MSGKRSRTKGHNFEREIANDLRKVFPDAKRQLEYQEDTCQGVDIANTGLLKIQCKVRKTRHVPITVIDEVLCKEGEVPVLVSKVDRGEVLCVLKWKNLLNLIEIAEKNK